MEEKGLMCLNDGRGTRIDVNTGNRSAIDLTLVSDVVAGSSEWEVWEETTIGSDHCPTVCTLDMRTELVSGIGVGKWIVGKAEWDKFLDLSEENMVLFEGDGDVDNLNDELSSVIYTAATGSILEVKEE